jgi:hypothetical protein
LSDAVAAEHGFAKRRGPSQRLNIPTSARFTKSAKPTTGLLYLVMPLYDGETVQELLARGPLSIEHAVRIAVEVVARPCQGTWAQASFTAIIKPSNVLVTEDGHVKGARLRHCETR